MSKLFDSRRIPFPINPVAFISMTAAVAFGFSALGSLGADESESAGERIDWQATGEVRWDREQRRLISVQGSQEAAEESSPPRQNIRWDTLDQIRWDPESRSFVMSERAPEGDGESREFDPRNYRLSVRDQVDIQVFDEPMLSLTQRIDGSGQIRIPLLGNHPVTGLSVREAEDFIEKLYVENRILRNPIVTVRVVEYAPREVAILGAVGRPGTQEFPIERNEMDIVEIVSRAGGFTGIARSNQVSVTRSNEEGQERTVTVNVESMITGRGSNNERFMVQPGDVIWVPERVF